jgi:transcriptional regulator with XRE-family HTH domain
MSELRHKLRIIRRQRRLSLRQVEKLTAALAEKDGDPSRRVSASWLGRLEREKHSIPHRTLETLEEVYGVSHEELTDEYISTEEASRTLHAHLPELPAVVLKELTVPTGRYLLPPESWLTYFPETTLLPSLPSAESAVARTGHMRPRAARLYAVLGANDLTLLGLVQPGAVLEIDHSARTIDITRVYHSVSERPIYFLRTHDGYHCGWCQLDSEHEWLTLVPSTLTKASQRRWRYRHEVEVVGLVTRVLTRLWFSKGLKLDQINRDRHSNSS